VEAKNRAGVNNGQPVSIRECNDSLAVHRGKTVGQHEKPRIRIFRKFRDGFIDFGRGPHRTGVTLMSKLALEDSSEFLQRPSIEKSQKNRPQFPETYLQHFWGEPSGESRSMPKPAVCRQAPDQPTAARRDGAP
jgi:hypothetical protein